MINQLITHQLLIDIIDVIDLMDQQLLVVSGNECPGSRSKKPDPSALEDNVLCRNVTQLDRRRILKKPNIQLYKIEGGAHRQ